MYADRLSYLVRITDPFQNQILLANTALLDRNYKIINGNN